MILRLVFSLVLGYVFGNILTAEIVARKVSGKSVFELGSGNPGMANVMTELGFAPGAATLAGGPCEDCSSVPHCALFHYS